MLPRVCSTAVLVLLTFAALAQPAHLGDAFPLAGTRYGTARGHAPLLLSNGRDPVVFWTSDRTLRVSRFVNGRFVASRALGEIDGFDGSYDVVWTGAHFLVVFSGREDVFGLLLDATGEPQGKTFRIADGYAPRIAFNGRNILLLHFARDFTTGLHALLLTPEGRAAEAESRPLGVLPEGRVALASNGDSFAALVPNVFDPSLLFFDAGGRLRSTSIFAAHGGGAAIATDGRRYLGVAACAEQRLCMPAVSRLVEPDGTAGAPVELDQPFHANPSVVWNGTKWTVAYLRDLYLQEQATLQIVHLDSSARTIERREEQPAVQGSLGVIGGRVLAAWISNRYRDTIRVGPVPFDAATSVTASFTATEQSLSDIASSAHGTLVAWQERGNGRTTLHTGFRMLDGTWSEREILSILPRDCFFCYEEGVHVMAAGDGQQFMLYTSSADGSLMRRLDRHGNPIGEPFALPFFISQMLWTGRDYLLFHGERAVSRMTADGTIVSTVALPAVIGQSSTFAVSSDGGLIFVRIDRTYVNHYPRVVSLNVVRLDRELAAIDSAPIRLAVDDQHLAAPGVGWDGRQYVVTWVGRDGIMAAQLPPSGAVVPKERKIADGPASEFFIEAVAGGAAIQWNQWWGANRLTFLRHDGSTTTPLTLSTTDDRGSESGRIAPLANGDLAYVETSLQPAAPFENTTHLMFRVLSNAPLPPRPSAPRLTSTGAVLTWDAPPEPVDGFRLEARIDEGPWTEIAPPLPRDARSFEVTREPGSHYTFRIRAWNESGPGAYSGSRIRRRAAR